MQQNALREKMKEAAGSVIPVALIVLLLCFTISPMPLDLLFSFVIGAVMLTAGLGIFTFGAENSMNVIGNRIGAKMTASRSVPMILLLSFVIGVSITIAEPDLKVLSENVPHINSTVLVLTISAGVGLFLVLCMVRILCGIPLSAVLIACYTLLFVLALFADPDYLSVAFDAGGVTTGPMTSPLIMALGIGVAQVRSDKRAEDDSFGLITLSSIGPILAVLLLGFFYPGETGTILATETNSYANSVALGLDYITTIPVYLKECAVSLAPVLLFFLVFNAAALHLRKVPFYRILIGLLFTYMGLVLFLTGANVGFSSLGLLLGKELSEGGKWYLIVPVAMVIGWFIVDAEPAVHLLTVQVEEISNGAVKAKTVGRALSIAIALAAGLSVFRAMYGIPILYFLLPGYAIALVLTFFVPRIFTAIAFDAGGVASGPLTTTFLLPLAMGVALANGRNIITDAFGIVAMIAMMPLVTVQITGLISVRKKKDTQKIAYTPDSFEVIELWEGAE